MIHKEEYQRMADAVAAQRGCYALHVGRVGEDTFVYSLRPGSSAEFDPESQTVVTVTAGEGDDRVRVYRGEEAQAVLAGATLREFSTGRAIFRKYQTLVKNHSAIIGEGPGYAQAIVDAVASKAVKPTLLYQYLELADHYHKKLRISGDCLKLEVGK